MSKKHVFAKSVAASALLIALAPSCFAGTADGTPFNLVLNVTFGCTVTLPADFDYGSVGYDTFDTVFPSKGSPDKLSDINLRGALDRRMSVYCNGPGTYNLELSGDHDGSAGYNIQKYMWGTKGGGPNNRIKYRFVVGSSGTGVGDIMGRSALSRSVTGAGSDSFVLTTLIDNIWDTVRPIPDTYRDHITIRVEW